MKLWRVEHFWTYLSSLLGVIAEYKIGTLAWISAERFQIVSSEDRAKPCFQIINGF